MKRNIRTIIFGLAVTVIMAVPLTGCQLAREDAGPEGGEHLVGVLVTREYLDLFDMEEYLNDHAGQIMKSGSVTLESDTSPYERRMYGEWKEDRYVFEGTEGIALLGVTLTGENGEMYRTIEGDEGFSDVSSGVVSTEDGETCNLEATIYVTARKETESSVYYMNPVYQSGDGSVYVTAGQGVGTAWSGEEGGELSQSMSDTVSLTENGQKRKETMNLKISIVSMYAPERIRVLQMDEESRCISRKEYLPEQVPEELTLERTAAYLIVETEKRDAEGKLCVSRSITNPADETMKTFYAREDGICVSRETVLHWASDMMNTSA